MSFTLLQDLKDRHRGRTIAVLGGGESLVQDIKQVPRGALLIGVNQHSLILDLDYVFFTDHPAWPLVSRSDAPKISHLREYLGFGDICSEMVPGYNFSGPRAVWVADWFGASRIIICGCDDYTGERAHWYGELVDPSCRRGGRESAMWQQLARDIQHPERVEFASGPLAAIFHGAPAEA